MRIVVLDAETYYGDDYTLSKMTTEAYIRDPRFEAHGAAIKWSPNHNARWYDRRDLPAVLAQEDWGNVMLVCHHTAFDGLILSHHYDVHPKMMACTLSMARLLLGNHISVSLDNVRARYGIPAKKTPYHLFKGKKPGTLPPADYQLLAEGCEDEVESIYNIFTRMLNGDY